ncbi:MAG: hypothetical protein ACRCW0_04095 [Clostridium sp.]
MKAINEKLILMFNNSGEKIKVGELLKKENKYYFKYDIEGVKKSTEFGFEVLENFPRINAQYFKEEVFTEFRERLASDHLTDEEVFDLLKRTGGKLAEDKLEFVTEETDEEIIKEVE